MERTHQQIRFCTSFDGTRIAYATTGTGPPLVRVGNWLTHVELDWGSPIWSHWFEELTRRHRLIRYDLRGSGLSERAVEDLSLDAWVRDLEAVVRDLGIERFSLLGLCQGGSIAVAYAARHPERVDRLVLYGSYPNGALTPGATFFERMEAETLAKMIRVGWGRNNAAFRRVFAHLLMPESSPEQQEWLAELERQSATTREAARLWRAFHQIDIRPLAPLVKAPTLAFHVKEDGIAPFQGGCHLASLIPDAHFVPLAGENHILLPDEPAWAQFISRLQSFLAPNEGQPSLQEEGFGELTRREREVLELISQGLSNDEIAAHLFISEKTVRNHITHLFDKLGITRRAEAIVRAREAGYGRRTA